MAATLIRLLPRRKIDGSNYASTTSTIITLAEHIFIGAGTDVELIVRLHRTNLGSGSSLTLNLVQDLYDSQDPGNIFLNFSVVAQITLTSTSVAPFGIASAASPSNVAPRFASLQVSITKTTNACDADISVDLNLRSYERYAFPLNSYLGFRY